MEDKKILFVSRGLGLGGAQKMLVYVANICADAGYQVSLISLKNQNTSLLLDDRIAVTKLNYLSSIISDQWLKLIETTLNS